MKKRLKIIITSSMLVFSLALMAFGVYAATSHTLGVENYISFDIGDNISCEIEALTAIGSTPDVSFNSSHNNPKTINLSVDAGNTTFTKVSGNTDIISNAWSPWTESNKASLDFTNDTVYWIFKVTNTSDNKIQVRITDTQDKTLFTVHNSIRLYKKYGRTFKGRC